MTRPDWLPGGDELPQFAALRPRHHELLEQAAQAEDELEALAPRFREEAEQHAARLRGEIRGDSGATPDRRTPAAERERLVADARQRLEAVLAVLLEWAESVIRTARINEDLQLAQLRDKLGPVAEGREEAERLLAEALAAEWKVDRTARWLQGTADGFDGQGFSLQPAPTGEERPPSPQWQLRSEALARPWHARRPWNVDHSAEGQSGEAA